MNTEPAKKVFIKTYGCQMNVYDSERISDVLAPLGYGMTDQAADADLVILNTCHIREKAAEKVYSELGKIKRLKQKREKFGASMRIAVAGCVAQAEGEEIIRRAPAVDIVFGPQSYQRLPQLISRREAEGRAIIETEFPAEDKFEALGEIRKRDGSMLGVTAFLTVQEGCDKFCTFCVVPYTRGGEFSRPVAQIEVEARKLANSGIKEITLLGQNVNAYRGPAPDGEIWSLGRLIRHLSRIDGIERWRYTTSHPRDMDDELIEAHASNEKLMPYLHLPIQAGSDRVLKAMNRGHTASTYFKIIERVRAARPDIAMSGDFIVGFPGETEEDFEATLAAVQEVKYASAFFFKYSPRPGTPAAERDDQVPDEVKADRLSRLRALLEAQRNTFNAACLGRQLPVLLEKPGRRPGQIVGRSPYLQPVYMDDSGLAIGQIVETVIDGVGATSLSAHIQPHP
jgi:tRNA-2-methylthio-N6-dimethylallyladenosine synthase